MIIRWGASRQAAPAGVYHVVRGVFSPFFSGGGLWFAVADSQTVSWSAVTDTQTPIWSAVTDSQTPVWVTIDESV